MTASGSAVSARAAAGLTIEAAARRARVTPAYLRQIERRGGAPYALACRLSRLDGAPLDTFLKRKESSESERTRVISSSSSGRRHTGRTPPQNERGGRS
jgi:transcriptional regulator with XRE-family HTH domain